MSKELSEVRIKKSYVACSESELFRVISQVRLIQRPGASLLLRRIHDGAPGLKSASKPTCPPDVVLKADSPVRPQGLPEKKKTKKQVRKGFEAQKQKF
ncbi:MAG TPA: hypothetical protein VHY08_19770 [Bacillota bacterium]|nr:hypothetical protein [Bacillota bacterium]